MFLVFEETIKNKSYTYSKKWLCNLAKLLLIGVTLFSFLPLSFAQYIGAAVGWVFSFSPSSVKRITAINIDRCFSGASRLERKKLVRLSVMHTIITATEMPKIFMAKPSCLFSSFTRIIGYDDAKKDFDAGNGVLFIGPHFGCWEVAGLKVSHEFPVHTLYSPSKSKVVSRLVEKARSRSGAVMSEASNRGVMAMFKALKKKQCVAILADQVPDAVGGCYIPFFGVPALTMTLVAKLYEKCSPKVYITYAVRNGIGKGYSMFYVALDKYIGLYENNIALTSDQTFLYAMNKCFEDIIMSSPEQYEWSYKRFKWQPACMLDPYSKEEEYLP